MVVDVAYLDYTKCIAVALVGDMILGLVVLGTDQTKKGFAFSEKLSYNSIITIKKGPRYGNY